METDRFSRALTSRVAPRLVAPHVPTPLLAQIDQLPFTFQHTLLEQSEGFARVEILRTA